jgi:peroxiredoxin Q/BCP
LHLHDQIPHSFTSIYLRDTNATAPQLRDRNSNMPAELRKRKEAPPAPVRPAKKKAPAKGKKAETEKTVVEKVQETVAEAVEAVKEAVAPKANGEASKPAAAKTSGPAKTGDTIDLTAFGGEVETHEGNKTTLAKLVEESKGGVVLFTYPKASTPGCTSLPHHSLHSD